MAAIVAGLSFAKLAKVGLITIIATQLRSVASTNAVRGVAEATGGDVPIGETASAILTMRAAADARAAELFGMRWVAAGGSAEEKTLEPDPGAQRSIIDTMRNEVATTVEKALVAKSGEAAIGQAVRALALFDETHAAMIAATEAMGIGNKALVQGYLASGIGLNKRWNIETEACATCRANAAEGAVALGHVFKSGHTEGPAHPHCRCVMSCEPIVLGKAYNPQQLRDAAGRWTSFGAFVDEALSITDKHVIHQIGEVANAAEIQKAIGVDLTGWSRRVDNYALHHAIKHHGVPGVEEKRGQIAITPMDLRQIGNVVSEPDQVSDGGLGDRGLRVIVSEKVVSGERLFIAEEIRGRKHRTVVMITMWKRKEK